MRKHNSKWFLCLHYSLPRVCPEPVLTNRLFLFVGKIETSVV
eukprot:COSAG06_NODE_39541_length_411_cov_1.076923_1_plen_41_part_10